MIDRGTNYKTVAVIGCQSSGKSTLLNLLFDTTFEVMDESKGRQQTTKGIWLNRNLSGDLLVMDIEGTDSKERGEQRMVRRPDSLSVQTLSCATRPSSKPLRFSPLPSQTFCLSTCGQPTSAGTEPRTTVCSR